MLQAYLNKLNPPELAQSVQETVNGFLAKLDETAPKKSKNVLLLGNVQSGKTAQVLGVLSALAERDNKLFIYLTTDSVDLQQQTLKRAQNSLDKFIVLSEENDNLLDEMLKQDLPILAVIKKNASILKRWRNTFASKKHLHGYPLIIVDDEADAASLNTNADKNKDASTINQHLSDIKNACCQNLFIQLTATPQSILLQNEASGWQPEFVHYFQAGEHYIGGKFVFTDPPSYITRLIDIESPEVKDESAEISIYLLQATQAFLLTCAEFALCGKTNANFAIHTSIRTDEHQAFANKIRAHLNDLVQALNNGENLAPNFQAAYDDLRQTKPDIHHFEDVFAQLCEMLEEEQFQVAVFNSKNETNADLSHGWNIIVGGNVIGRGLTIPKLQTVYYSRTAKKPNADTFWQHSRIFGYDRDKSLLRLYIPYDVYRFFVTLNQANDLLIEQVCQENGEPIQMIYPPNVNPTRKNVLVSGSLNNVMGGVNYFPSFPDENNLDNINRWAEHIRQNADQIEPDLYEVDSETIIEILTDLGQYQNDDWHKEKFIACIQAVQTQRPSFKSYVLLKENRRLSRGTGTMLSQDDRAIGERKNQDLLLTLYQVTGEIERGWGGTSFWLPNIKLPNKGMIYWSVLD